MSRLVLFAVLLPLSATAQPDAAMFLPRNYAVRAVVTTASGDVVVGGQVSEHAFLAKMTPDLATVTATREFSGSGQDSIDFLVAAADGSIYAAGNTTSNDFPARSLDASAHSPSAPRAFLIKVNNALETRYAVFPPGGSVTYARGLAVNSQGEALLSGQTNTSDGFPPFPASPGTLGALDETNNGFLLKLDPSGTKVQLSLRGYGGGPVAFGPDGDIFVASTLDGDRRLKVSDAAFQTTHGIRACSGTLFIGAACLYQTGSRISSDGTRLIYSTFITGSSGAAPSAIFVDSDGNAVIAGTTFSDDYPVTEGAFQTSYRATNQPPPEVLNPHPAIHPPPAAGFVTKLNAAGSRLIWSTFFGGTGSENVTGASLDAEGRMAITGVSGSADLPGAARTPSGCTPVYSREIRTSRV